MSDCGEEQHPSAPELELDSPQETLLPVGDAKRQPSLTSPSKPAQDNVSELDQSNSPLYPCDRLPSHEGHELLASIDRLDSLPSVPTISVPSIPYEGQNNSEYSAVAVTATTHVLSENPDPVVPIVDNPTSMSSAIQSDSIPMLSSDVESNCCDDPGTIPTSDTSERAILPAIGVEQNSASIAPVVPTPTEASTAQNDQNPRPCSIAESSCGVHNRTIPTPGNFEQAGTGLEPTSLSTAQTVSTQIEPLLTELGSQNYHVTQSIPNIGVNVTQGSTVRQFDALGLQREEQRRLQFLAAQKRVEMHARQNEPELNALESPRNEQANSIPSNPGTVVSTISRRTSASDLGQSLEEQSRAFPVNPETTHNNSLTAALDDDHNNQTNLRSADLEPSTPDIGRDGSTPSERLPNTQGPQQQPVGSSSVDARQGSAIRLSFHPMTNAPNLQRINNRFVNAIVTRGGNSHPLGVRLHDGQRSDTTNGWYNSSSGDLQAQVAVPSPETATGAGDRPRAGNENDASTRTSVSITGVGATSVPVTSVEEADEEDPSRHTNTPAPVGNVTRISIQDNTSVQGITIAQNRNRGQPALIPQQPGARHRIVRVSPVTRHFTIPAGTGANIRIQGNVTPQRVRSNDPNNPNIIPRVVISPLEAQAILTSNRDHAANKSDDEHDKYRCNICYEFFVDPSSCGRCASRFCHECLLKVVATPNLSNSTISKCPACRAILTVEGIVRDQALQDEMLAANLQVCCSFVGCNQRLPSASMKDHEQSCPYTPMRCKNSIMGCRWNGLRKDLTHHESECALERVAGLVDQFRHCRADYRNAIISLKRGQTMNSQLVEMNSALMRRALPSPSNIIDLFNLVYTSACTTSYFLYTADIWRRFLNQEGAQECRAMVGNVLYMLPTIFNACRTAVGGYRLLLTLHVEKDLQVWVGNLELGVLSLTPFLLLIAATLCLLLDGLSAMKFSQLLFYGLSHRKIYRDLTTVAMLLINVVVIECDGAGSAAFFLWTCVLLSTTCFPPIILTILGLASGIPEPNPHQIFSAGRMACVALFALRHAAVAAFLGIGPFLDGSILSQLLRRNFSFVVKYDLVPVSDGIWTSVRSEQMFAYVGIRIGMWAIAAPTEGLPWLSIIGLISFLLINFIVHQLTILGISIGIMVFREGKSNVLSNQLGVRKAFTVSGTLAFCIWSSLLLVIAVTF